MTEDEIKILFSEVNEKLDVLIELAKKGKLIKHKSSVMYTMSKAIKVQSNRSQAEIFLTWPLPHQYK